MRTVIDARFLSVPGTGISSYIRGLINGITQCKLEDEYTFIVPQGFGCQNRYIKIKSSNIPVVSVRQHLLMPFYFFKVKPDVYHYPHFDPPFTPRSALIITIHDLKYVKMPGLFYGKSKEKAMLMRIIMKNSIRRAQKVITVSQSTKEDIVNVLKVPSSKIEVIYEACDPFYRIIPDPVDSVLKKHGVQLPYLLFVGEIRPHKNIPRLLTAFKRLKNKDYQLIIVGKTYREYKEPFELVEELGIQDRVKFLRYVSKEDLINLYNAATVFILPSLYEGFGLPVLEAMACGTPVITSRVSSLPEVAGNAALLINPYDTESITSAVDQILSSPSLQQRLQKEGIKRVKKFSWSKTARKSIKVYRTAFNEKKGHTNHT